MPEEPIRVAMIMGKMVGGGVEAVVMNYYRHIDKRKIQFDFIVDSDSTRIPKEEILKLGGRILTVSPYQQVLKYTKDLEKVFKENNYKIVHSHINTLSVIPLFVAKKCLIPIRIAHNHSTVGNDQIIKNLFKYTLKLFSTLYPTHYMSPIYSTGEWLFGKKIAKSELYILPNAFDTQKFSFNSKTRDVIRKKLGIEKSDYVIGNVGRMVHSKNQVFILQILNKICISKSNIKFLLIGDGPLYKEILKKIKEFNIINNVVIVSNTEEIEQYYMAMDLFVFPSYYEGLGLAAVEAQATGLPVIASNKLPNEIEVSKYLHTIDLLDEKEWQDKINFYSNLQFKRQTLNKDILINHKYDIESEVKKLESYYFNLLYSKVR